MDFNRVTVIGHASNNPEQKTLTSGATVTRLNVATNYAWKDASSGERKEKVNFHTIIAWNKLGNNFAEYVKKGDRVFVEGHVDYRTFTGKNGQPKYVTDIVAERMIMLGKPARQEKTDEAAVVENDPAEVPFVELAD